MNGTIHKHFHLSWPVPIGVVVLVLVAALVWVVAIYSREARPTPSSDLSWPQRSGRRLRRIAGLAALRLLALGLLVLLWAEPTLERSRLGAPSLVLLVDRSASMNHRDPQADLPAPGPASARSPVRGVEPDSARPSRFARLVRGLLAGQPSLLDRLQQSYRLELVVFADQIRRLEPAGSQTLAELLRGLSPAAETTADASTRLGDAVDFALGGGAGGGLAGGGPAAIVLLSDGIGTRGQSLTAAARRARNLGVPLYTVAVGSAHPRADVALDAPVAADRLFLGDALAVESAVRAVGLAGRSARVVLVDMATGQVLDQTTVRLSADGARKEIHLQALPKRAGRLVLELRVALVPATQGAVRRSAAIAAPAGRPDSQTTDSPAANLPVDLPATDSPATDSPVHAPALQHPRASARPEDGSGEANLENNRRRLEVQVHQEPIRVLLVQSSPSYEFRALKETLGRDPALQLRVWLQEAERRYWQVDALALRHFPLSQQALNSYDVVIWGDANPEPLPRSFWSHLVRWVTERGGGLALSAGPQYFPAAYRANVEMGLLLPIQPGGGQGVAGNFSIRPTAAGRRDPCLRLAGSRAASQAAWQGLPTFHWLWQATRVKPGGQQLAAATSADTSQRWPAVVRHFVGSGEVWMHLTDETWRLRYRSDGRLFATYWGRLVRRLGRGKLVAGTQGMRLTTDRQEYQLGAAVRVRAQFYDSAQAPAKGSLILQWESRDQPRRPLELARRADQRGLFEATLPALPAGVYQLHWLPRPPQADRPAESKAEPTPAMPAPVSVKFTVHAPAGEMARLVVDRRALSAAARESHGKSYTPATVGQLPADLPPTLPVTLEHLPSQRLASQHTVIGLLIGLLVVEWILRRRNGLV